MAETKKKTAAAKKTTEEAAAEEAPVEEAPEPAGAAGEASNKNRPHYLAGRPNYGRTS